MEKKENRNFIVSQITSIIGASSTAIILIYIIIIKPLIEKVSTN